MALLVEGAPAPAKKVAGVSVRVLAAAAFVLLLVAAGVAVALSAAAQQAAAGQRQAFGGGEADVISPVGTADVQWELVYQGGVYKVDKARLTFDETLTAGSIVAVQARNGSGGIIAGTPTQATVGTTAGCGGGGGLGAGTPCTLDLGTNPTAESVEGVDVTAMQLLVGSIPSTGVNVTRVEWVLLSSDITKVNKVKVTLGVAAGVNVSPATAHLKLEGPGGVVLAKTKFSNLSLVGGGSGATVTLPDWNLPSPYVLAESIIRFQVQVTQP